MPKKIVALSETEEHNPRYRGVHKWRTSKILGELLKDQIASLQVLKNEPLQIMAEAVDEATNTLELNKDGRFVYGTAGTPTRLAHVDGPELWPTFGLAKSRIAFAFAGGARAMYQAVENAEDNTEAAIRKVKKLKVSPKDIFITISASGETPFTIAACKAAKDAGAMTIGISSNKNSTLMNIAKYPIYTKTGAEPVRGSTRMNAGTAEMVLLKLFSTAVMTKMGRVYDGYMVSMIPTNDKLRLRATRDVSDITGCTRAEAKKALDQAKTILGGNTDRNIKLAILLIKGMSKDTALAQMTLYRDHLDLVLESFKP